MQKHLTKFNKQILYTNNIIMYLFHVADALRAIKAVLPYNVSFFVMLVINPAQGWLFYPAWISMIYKTINFDKIYSYITFYLIKLLLLS